MRTAYVAGCALAIAIGSSSCGGGSGGSTPSSPSPPAGATTISVLGERGSSSFTPNPATVTQGQAVVWYNADGQTHRIVFNDESLDTGDIAPGATSASRPMPVNGARYHCSIHPAMLGSINASSGAPPPCNGPYCE